MTDHDSTPPEQPTRERGDLSVGNVRPSDRSIGRVPPLRVGGLLIVLFALASTTLHLRGLTVADARLEHVLDPRQFLARHLQIWDDARGAGTSALYFSPFVASFQSLLSALGLAPWLIGRLTLALYLSIAGIGAMRLAARLQPEHRWLPVVSGMLYAFSPFTSQFIIPSGLFVPAAALPWLLLIALYGLQGDRPWRAGARFALVVGAVGLLNTASLLFVLAPVAIFVVLLVALEHEGRRRVALRFAGISLVLTVFVSAAMLTVLSGSLGSVARNLATTESPSTVARTSTASESWRGLGLWLSYFRIGRVYRPGAGLFFTNAAFITLTFLTPFLAVVGIAARRVRWWRIWALLMLFGLVVMVGANGVTWTPVSSFLDRLFDDVPSARAFRSTYKAGAAPGLAVAILAPSGALAAARALGRHRWGGLDRLYRWLAPTFVAGACAGGIVPFATGAIFIENDSFRTVPSYWQQALDTLATVPNDRVLVMPGVSRYRYSWGYVNDNLFDAELAPAALYGQTVGGATPSMMRVIEELDARISTDRLDPDAVAPMMSALGARWLLVQHDVTGADFTFPDRLRNTRGLALARSFGDLGNGRPALELYRLADDEEPLDALWRSAPPLIVSGGEGVLATLAQQGWLERDVVNMTTLSAEQRASLIDAGAEIVVADGSQRRAVQLGLRKSESVALDAEVEPSRPVMTSAPDDTDTQTVLEVESLTVESTTDAEIGGIWAPGLQPALMLDGSRSTAWQTDQRFRSAVGQGFRFELDEPMLIESVDITQLTDSDDAIELILLAVTEDDGHRTDITARLEPDGTTVVPIGRTVAEVEVTIATTDVGFGVVGISELEFVVDGGTLDTDTSLRLPVEVASLPDTLDPPISYVFSGLQSDEEGFLRRTFVTVRDQTFTVRGRLEPLEPLDAADDECLEIFSVDGSPVPVRPVEGATWDSTSIDVVACDDLSLDAGSHRLIEDEAYGRAIAAVSFIDTAATTSPGAPIAGRAIQDDRRSASEHTYSIPATGGYLSTTVPFHPGWKLDAGERDVEQLDSFARTLWAVAPGETTTATATFGRQRLYLAALVVSLTAALVCLALSVGRRRQ